MDPIQKNIILAIKSALTGQAFPLADFPFGKAVPVLLRQNAISLCYAGLCNSGLSPDLPDMRCLQSIAQEEAKKSLLQMLALDVLFQSFDAHGIEHMPVKGSVMKGLYPSPELRPMGDADILIHREQYPIMKPLMEKLGYRAGVESDHEYNWYGDHLHVELHKHLVPTYHPDYCRYFGDGWSKAATCEKHCWSMTPEDSFIYNFVHFAKHFRSASVGIRYIPDLWVHLRSYPDMDRGYIRAELDKLQLADFYDNILSVINAWFYDGPTDENTDFITEFLFNSSLWGHENEALATAVKKMQEENINLSQSKQMLLRNKLFPSRQTLNYSYPQLKKVPLPIAWVCRWFRVLFSRSDKLHSKADEITDDAVARRIAQMESIGIKFSK